jgi:hypothetical protein
LLSTRIKGRVRSRLSGLIAMSVLCVALAPAAAQADLTNYWSGDSGGTGLSGRHADATRSFLTSSEASAAGSSYEIWAGAHYAGGNTLYASWATGAGHACHHYGTNDIGAMFETPYNQYYAFAYSGWQGSLGSYYC